MFLYGVITELTHFSEAGLPHALQILTHLLTRFLVRVSSSLQKLRNSLASVCSWCTDVIFHQCVEGASTLIVVLEEQDHPMQFITPMAQNSFPELYAGSTILEGYLPASIPDQSVMFVPHTIAVLRSHLGRAAFVGGCMWRRSFLRRTSPQMVCSSVRGT